jgi:DNA-binding GntR family transcriptional regulator
MSRTKPRHDVIARNLIEAIAAGRYDVGQTLPTEHQLSALFRVSRFTASHALDQLEQLGLVSRRPRHGTRVISRFPLSSFVEQGGMLQEWTGYGTEFVLEIDTIDERPALATLGLEGAARRPWLYLAGLRRPKESQLPACLSEIWVHPDYKDIRDRITARPPLIFTLIEERYGPLIRRVRHELTAVPIAESIARRLNVEVHSPGLQTVRRYFGPRDQLVELVVNTHPHDRFTYAIEVRRSIERKSEPSENSACEFSAT